MKRFSKNFLLHCLKREIPPVFYRIAREKSESLLKFQDEDEILTTQPVFPFKKQENVP